MVGNKSDYRDGTSDSRAEVVKEDAQRFSKENGLKYFETSAVSYSLFVFTCWIDRCFTYYFCVKSQLKCFDIRRQ